MSSSLFFALFLVFMISVFETISQVCFKSAVEKIDHPTDTFREIMVHSFRLLFVFRIWLGMWIGLATLFLWMLLLAHSDLNFAFSLSSLHYIFIALSSKFILHEPMNRYRWAGTILVALGIVIVSYTHTP